jgi:hypothetical protein
MFREELLAVFSEVGHRREKGTKDRVMPRKLLFPDVQATPDLGCQNQNQNVGVHSDPAVIPSSDKREDILRFFAQQKKHLQKKNFIPPWLCPYRTERERERAFT